MSTHTQTHTSARRVEEGSRGHAALFALQCNTHWQHLYSKLQSETFFFFHFLSHSFFFSPCSDWLIRCRRQAQTHPSNRRAQPLNAPPSAAKPENSHFSVVNSPHLIGCELDGPYQMCGVLIRNVFPPTGSHCGAPAAGWHCVCQPNRHPVSIALTKNKRP